MNWDLMNFLATSALTIAIYGLQRSHEKEREQMEVEAQKKAVAERRGSVRKHLCERIGVV